jgi:hypothetical protein
LGEYLQRNRSEKNYKERFWTISSGFQPFGFALSGFWPQGHPPSTDQIAVLMSPIEDERETKSAFIAPLQGYSVDMPWDKVAIETAI